ncbi:(2E,6E)-farnesyl diphosphate synthase [Mycobacterium marinum]|uniref:geranylgeranyl diphosphate synthase IdsB n=1 Tax=Mycobacterium marinum TaxID=1781 RepID=UPI0003588EE3|nr:geranylgeranyl diphosphate synthase IdsB [Mycobacterium marinum]AXN50501.1 (2E,6E)-farnesyl diphosphate synthase [Mycobacterium marinum]EPQ80897.1 Octaprenyl-diphosphate synthase [Mycobacterium marinum str. Europe]RFZ14450.1 (2E,6E)-farnesyl diphosphate synthase [Mycobacterium marinum]RFZ15190.1 (2E,6E)-farnesyl diphosphate synthase [Mycobacterium marinum]RFZ18807.1 (2E,6E)-farnesyl diphosphate synthase [Mycobacterium marinum]
MSLGMVNVANATPNAARALLKNARQECDPVLRTAVGWLSEPLAKMAGYHLGWWDVNGVPVDGSSGKSIRAALAFGAASACGDARAAAPVAAAVELMHNFSLVHDDVMDRDATRRGRATVWAVWGETNAIVLGDALHALAGRVLVEMLEPEVAANAVMRLESSCVTLCDGQFEDCDFETRESVSVDGYLEMAAGKTAGLMGCSCALGALAANADPATVTAMHQFGFQLGLAFQIVDDVMGLWGDPNVTGKPVGSDLARRKKTFPVVAALGSGTEAAASLAQLYGAEEPMSADEVRQAIDLVETAGGRKAAERQADECIGAALAALPDSARSEDLIALTQLVIARDR